MINTGVHPLLVGVADHIAFLERDNESLRKSNDVLWEEIETLNKRIKQLESCESELKQLVSIIDRSRKEAFAPDAGPKKYKVIDGVPVFEN